MKKSTGHSKKKIKGFARPTHPANNKGESPGDGVRERTTGEEGNATPHRVSVENRRELQDPTKEFVDLADTEVRLPSLPVTELESLRFKWDTGLDELIEKFEDARKDDKFDAVVWANRHLVTEALLYRFTSAILRVETEKSGAKWEEESQNMRELRRRLIASTWDFDMPFKRAVLYAEERLMNVLKSSDIKRSFLQRAGASTKEVDAMWVVVYAAVAAWEEQGRENAALQNVDMQNALATVALLMRETDAIGELLNPCLKTAAEVLNLADQNEQSEKLDILVEEDVVKLGELIEQTRLLPINAYNGLTRRLETILDFMLAKRYNIEPLSSRVETIRFEPPKSDFFSNLSRISVAASPNNW